MSRQSAPAGALLGAVLVAGFVVWILSVIWVYLLTAAVVALIGWAAWAVARLPRSTTDRPQLVTVHAPRLAAPPEDYHRPILPVDPSVFSDPQKAETAALQIFTEWTRGVPMAPADPTDVVRSLEMRIRLIGRLATEVAERKVAWREVALSTSAKVTRPKVPPEALDPWGRSAEALKADSLHVAPCSRCGGDEKIPCTTCSGSTRAPCAACSGAGKSYGYTANGAHRLLNCKACRGKGSLKCSDCAKGKMPCPACHGSGRSERWLEVTEAIRHDVQIEPDGEMTRAFRWGKDGTPATRSEIEADAKLTIEISADGPIPYDEISRRVPADWLELNWRRIQPTLAPEERARRQTFWMLEVPSIELSYAVAAAAPTVISLEGRRMLAPPAALDQQFAARAHRIRKLRYALVGLVIAVPSAYLLRGAYYWSGWIAALCLCLAGLAVCLDGLARDLTLRRSHARIWVGAIGATALLMCGFAIAAEPSVRAARRQIAAGQYALARAELQALAGAPQATQVEAELRLAELLKQPDADLVLREAALLPAASKEREVAHAHLRQLVQADVQRDLSAGKPDAAERDLARATAALKTSAEDSAVVRDLQGRIQDLRHDKCQDDGCRWLAARAAAQAMPTAARQQRESLTRARLASALDLRDVPDEPTVTRLLRLSGVVGLAAEIDKSGADRDLVAKAHVASSWARQARSRTPLVGSERAVVTAILGAPIEAHGRPPRTVLSGVAAYWSLRGDRCAGIYMVGASADGRVLNDVAHAEATTQLLSQALGRQVPLPDRPAATRGLASTSSRWREAGVPVVARWRGGDLMELRIGEAAP